MCIYKIRHFKDVWYSSIQYVSRHKRVLLHTHHNDGERSNKSKIPAHPSLDPIQLSASENTLRNDFHKWQMELVEISKI